MTGRDRLLVVQGLAAAHSTAPPLTFTLGYARHARPARELPVFSSAFGAPS
jgi:hypothetical protein